MAQWIGRWRNQSGSIVDIVEDADGVIRGALRTALKESGFYGQDVPIFGAAWDDVIGFTAAAEGAVGPVAVSYTGILREGKLEALWHTVGGHTLTAEAPCEPASARDVDALRAFRSGLDTFERER